MQKFLVTIALLCLGSYAVVCAFLFVFQRSLIYYPMPAPMLRAPAVSTLDVPGATLRIAERPRPGPAAVLYFGGNAEDVSATLPLLDEAFPDRALYLPHYRGYAGSTGTPTEAALVADALALFDRVAAAHPDIVVIGRSLGTGIAVQVASQRKVGRLVLVTPYDSLAGPAQDHYPFIPVRWLLRDRYESSRYAPDITAPTRLIVAQHDEIIPRASAERLLASFRKGVASMVVIPGATHNELAYPVYLRLLREDAPRDPGRH